MSCLPLIISTNASVDVDNQNCSLLYRYKVPQYRQLRRPNNLLNVVSVNSIFSPHLVREGFHIDPWDMSI